MTSQRSQHKPHSSDMTIDYLYEQAPLVEVIAEIHWALKTLDTAPGTKIDPYYDLFKDGFLAYAKTYDLVHVQELVPNIVPLELLANQPQLRLRSAPGRWPLAQIGPGIVTANIVPPYDGWTAFEPFLHRMVDGLFDNYPIANRTLRIAKLHLRYIDGFDERFGLVRYSDFASEMLDIHTPLPAAFVKSNVKPGTEVATLLENRFQNIVPDGSAGKVKLAPGQINNRSALIMELHCESQYNDDNTIQPQAVKDWFAEAHQCLHSQFETLTTPALKKLMGEKREIQ